jgi:Ser/Thr protein kinase RdoA (MazF antagonist)
MLQSISAESVDKILENCGLAKSKEIERLTGGWVNSTFKISTVDDEKYALRVYTKDYMNRSTNALTFEVDLLCHLKNHHLPVPKVCKAKNTNESNSLLAKNGIHLTQDNYYSVIFEFVEGVKFVNGNPAHPEGRQKWQALKIAQYLGKQHKLTYNNIEWKSESRCAIDYIEIKDHILNDHPDWAADHPKIFARIGNICKHLAFLDDPVSRGEFVQRLATVPQGVIHADLHDENVLFDERSYDIAAVLDFDDAFYGPLVADVAQSIFCWCFVGPELDVDLTRAFMNEYQQSRGFPFTADEWKIIVSLYYITGVMQLNYMIELLDPEEIWMIKDTTETMERMIDIGQDKFVELMQLQ